MCVCVCVCVCVMHDASQNGCMHGTEVEKTTAARSQWIKSDLILSLLQCGSVKRAHVLIIFSVFELEICVVYYFFYNSDLFFSISQISPLVTFSQFARAGRWADALAKLESGDVDDVNATEQVQSRFLHFAVVIIDEILFYFIFNAFFFWLGSRTAFACSNSLGPNYVDYKDDRAWRKH